MSKQAQRYRRRPHTRRTVRTELSQRELARDARRFVGATLVSAAMFAGLSAHMAKPTMRYWHTSMMTQ